jgi:hypothetical protein
MNPGNAPEVRGPHGGSGLTERGLFGLSVLSMSCSPQMPAHRGSL